MPVRRNVRRARMSEPLGVKIAQLMQKLRRSVVERRSLGDRGRSRARLLPKAT
jgi:hypothetical protein